MPIIVNKKIAETPLELIERVRKENNINSSIKMTYAGRLDPAAEGLMILLSGDEVYRKEDYLGLDKEYQVEFLFGLKTDTGDLFGVLKKESNFDLDKEKIKEVLNSFIGKYSQKYPIFSSKTVGGKQLFNLIDEISVDSAPEHQVELKEVEHLGFNIIGIDDVKERFNFLLKNIKGDFRYKEIKYSWNDISNQEFLIMKVRLKVSSGFYIRQLAFELGQKINVPILTYSINRTAIGSYKK